MKNLWISMDALAPALAAQLFAVVLIYMLLVRKRMTGGYRLYAVFLICLIVMLSCRSIQVFLKHPYTWYISWGRVWVFMAAGIPALLIVSARQAGIRVKGFLRIAPFIVGTLLATLYVFLQDARLQHGLFPEAWTTSLPFTVTILHCYYLWWLISLGMLVLPNLYFIAIEWGGRRNVTHLAFMSGAVLFGFLMALGALYEQLAVYYVGSMVSAIIWMWAMFQHVREMKGRAGVLKDELEWQVQSGRIEEPGRFERRLAELETLSGGDEALYKMRMRELLTALTDATIRAGGDSAQLIERSTAREKIIEQSEDTVQVRELVRDEAVELSGMITKMQGKKETVAVRKAKVFMEQEYGRDLGVEEIAQHLALSKAYFMRQFKKGTGQTVNQYLSHLRIEKAKELLRRCSVTEAAFEVGYNHASYFSTVFKKETGMTPAEYKKSAQGH